MLVEDQRRGRGFIGLLTSSIDDEAGRDETQNVTAAGLQAAECDMKDRQIEQARHPRPQDLIVIIGEPVANLTARQAQQADPIDAAEPTWPQAPDTSGDDRLDELAGRGAGHAFSL